MKLLKYYDFANITYENIRKTSHELLDKTHVRYEIFVQS